MTLQYSTTLRNAKLDAIETTIGSSPTLEIRTGAQPASCGSTDTGTLLATVNLPTDWMTAASSAVKAMNGTWSTSAASGDGTAGHFRIKASTTCHMQGSVTGTTGGGDMTVDNTSFAAGQAFSVTSFSIADNNG